MGFSHALQIITNCSNMGLSLDAVLQEYSAPTVWVSHRVTVPARNSAHACLPFHRPELLPGACSVIGSLWSIRHFHVLWHQLLHGLQNGYLFWQGPHGYREANCLTLVFTVDCRESLLLHLRSHLLLLWPCCLQRHFSHTFSLLSHSCCAGFLQFIKYDKTELPPMSLTVSSLASSRLVLKMVETGFVQQMCSPLPFLTEDITAGPLIPKHYCRNLCRYRHKDTITDGLKCFKHDYTGE